MTSKKTFSQLIVESTLLSALAELGYTIPTSVQEQSIPIMLEGTDLLAQAQTGTGKTAAFALPILSHLDIKLKKPQALIVAPTRELAIQVAESFKNYAKKIKDFHVLPIYGGQDYQVQLRALKRGAHVIVGTPGRVMDHMRRGTLSVNSVKKVVLDEADKMLKMGFIDDVEWILSQIPHVHQVALFSATMPASIQKIAKRYLKNAKKIHVKPEEKTVNAIEQFHTRVSNKQKLDVLTRFLEVEDIQAAIIFARTKSISAELAEKLKIRGYAAAALNGDMSQSLRERVINQIKKGSLDIVVATDVAARGLDVTRVSHVINFDIPGDAESYIHRIGRTGRAGRKGKALLFVTPGEWRLLNEIEREIHEPIKHLDPPTLQEIKDKRNKQFAEKVISEIKNNKSLKYYREMIERLIEQNNSDPKDIAAALACLMQQSNPMPAHEFEATKPGSERKQRRPSNKYKGKSSGRYSKDKRSATKKSTTKRSTSSTKKTSKTLSMPSKRKNSKPKSSQGRTKRKKTG